VLSAETGFLLARRPDTVRAPDVAFVSAERLEQARTTRGFFPGPPDLAVEVLSPTDRAGEVHAKVADYLAAGTRLVWVVEPGRHTIRVYRTLLAPKTVGQEATLDGEEVLPGFRLPVSAVFSL